MEKNRPGGPAAGGPPPWARGGGPPAGAQDIPEEMRAIMPDFPGIRAALYRLDLGFAAVVFVIECLLFGLLYATGGLGMSARRYLLIHLVLPTVIYSIALIAGLYFNRRMSDQNIRKFTIPVFIMGIMTLTLCVIYCNYPIVLGSLLIPIGMTAAFTGMRDPRVPLFSLMSVALATGRRMFLAGTAMERVRFGLEGLVALCLLLVMLRVVRTVSEMTGGQRDKLLNFYRSTRAAQAQAEAAQARAEAASRAKSSFLANMSHEIRTPINAILGMNEMILRESKDKQITEYAGSIHSASASLLSLVNDVLDFSKIESGRLEIVDVNYDLASFFHDCYNMISERAEKKGLEVKVDISSDLPVHLRGDEVRLRQVVTNLLSNAVKYTERGSIFLSASGQVTGDTLSLTITVKDTGVGINEEGLQAMFTQFTRLDLEKNRTVEGAGLGLTITKQLVDLMGGKLEVQSIYGIGSAFTVTLPQKVMDATPMGDFHTRYLDVNRQNPRYQKKFEAPEARVLVVDDVEVNLKVFVNLLKETHIRVETAISGFQCLEMAAQCEYDIIFLDHMMPEMNGLETFQRLKEMAGSPNRDTPVVMLTANAITGVKEQYLQAGFSDYLSKPINGAKLEQTILKYLPPRLVHGGSYVPVQEEEVLPAEPDDMMLLQALFQACPQVDLVQGMEQCAGSAEIYLDVLRTFAKSMKDREIQACFEQRDAANYQILVHGVKSAARSVGFQTLSDQALALENASREEDWAQIEALHPAFCRDYRAAGDAVSSTLLGNNRPPSMNLE